MLSGDTHAEEDAIKTSIDWRHIYERAAAMGWTPQVLQKATIPELIYSFRGWQRANGIDPDAEVSRANVPISRTEAEYLFAKYG